MGNMDIVALLMERFSRIDLVLVAINAVLLLLSRPIFTQFTHSPSLSEDQLSRLHIFRVSNGLMLLVVLFYNLVLPLSDHSWVTRGLTVLLVMYLGYLGFHVADYVIKKRFGRTSEVNGCQVVSETYNSRVLGLIVAVLIFVVTLIGSVRILGFDTLLEAGGVIGFVGVLLALTQGSWAPDIISGLIILNSRLFKEGDVIEINEGDGLIGVIFKTKVFHTEILNIVNNHRIMMQNSKLRQKTLHNLSRFASAKGLREELRFKIGYGVRQSAIKAMLNDAFCRAIQSGDVNIEGQVPIEIRPTDAGDYAVSWSVFYYTKDVKNLLQIRQILLSYILLQAEEDGIGLSTPVLNEVQAQLEPAPELS